VPPDDFFDGEWEEPSRTQDTAPTRPAADEPGTTERPPRAPRDRTRRSSRPSIPRPSGMPALEGLEWRRLGMLAAGIIVLVLVLLLAARACSGSSATSKNQDYMTQVQAVLKKSDTAGSQLTGLLNSPQPIRRKQAVAQLTAIKGVAQSALNDATQLKPTSQTKQWQQYLLQALSYRVNGLSCLIQRAPAAYKAKRAKNGGTQLVPCMQQLLASDVIYLYSWANPVSNALRKAGIQVQVPTSQFLAGNASTLVSPVALGAALQHWKPGSVGKGLHGLQLDTVVARFENGKTVTLQAGSVNTVKVQNLSFLVTAHNGGNYTETNIPVSVTIGTGKSAVKKSATISSIGKGQTKTVEIGGFGSGTFVTFDKPIPVKVLVTPVPGEHTVSNNSQTYKIIFSL
jgi:hypothetical protein